MYIEYDYISRDSSPIAGTKSWQNVAKVSFKPIQMGHYTSIILAKFFQLTFTCSKSTIKTEKGVKNVQDISQYFLAFLLLTLKK